jgi:hypothetical protein
VTLPKTAATGKSSTNLIAESSAAFFSIDAAPRLGLAFEASVFRRQMQSRKWLEIVLARSPSGRGYSMMRRGPWSDRRAFQRGFASRRLFRIAICPEAINAQNNIAAVSTLGSTVCVLIRRLIFV